MLEGIWVKLAQFLFHQLELRLDLCLSALFLFLILLMLFQISAIDLSILFVAPGLILNTPQFSLSRLKVLLGAKQVFIQSI